MKKILSVCVISIFMLSTNLVYADNVGAGLGRVALQGQKGKVMELIGTFLNGLCGNGTFAITTGTLGYKNGATIGLNEEVKNFIAQNMDNLATDMAKGDGEYIDTLATLMQIENKSEFNNKMKANFSNIYTSYGVSAEQVAENIYKLTQS
jgi:hypothetical protein